jgi:hypothetical protein
MIGQQKDEIGLVYLKQAVFIAPGFSKAYRELGDTFARLGRSEEASAYRMKSSRIDSVLCGSAGEDVIMKKQVGNQTVHGNFPTCFVW